MMRGLANEQDWDTIAQLNHDTFAIELGQHAPNQTGRKTDRLHESNVYLVAHADNELVGMISITFPEAASFSTLNRVPNVSAEVRENLGHTAEYRLLAVKPTFRGRGVFGLLILAAAEACLKRGVDRVLISAIKNRVPLYQQLGFRAIAGPVMEGKAVYHPMLVTREALERSPYYRKLVHKKEMKAVA